MIISAEIKTTLLEQLKACTDCDTLKKFNDIVKNVAVGALINAQTVNAFQPVLEQIYAERLTERPEVKKVLTIFLKYFPQIAVKIKNTEKESSVSFLEVEAQSKVMASFFQPPFSEQNKLDLSHYNPEVADLFFKLIVHEEVNEAQIIRHIKELLDLVVIYEMGTLNTTLCNIIREHIDHLDADLLVYFYNFAKTNKNLMLYAIIKNHFRPSDNEDAPNVQVKKKSKPILFDFLRLAGLSRKAFDEEGGFFFNHIGINGASSIKFEGQNCHIDIAYKDYWDWIIPWFDAQERIYQTKMFITLQPSHFHFGGTCSEEEDKTIYDLPEIAPSVLEELRNRKNWVSLNLWRSELDDNLFPQFIQALNENPNVVELNFSNNLFTRGMAGLSQLLAKNPIRKLTLNESKCNLFDLADSIKFSSTLRSLSIYDAKSHSSEPAFYHRAARDEIIPERTLGEVMGDAIVHNTSLVDINISKTGFTGKDLANILRNNPRLKKIDAGSNRLSDVDLKCCIAALKEHPNCVLEKLRISCNENFSGTILVQLIKLLPNLKSLDVGYCNLQDNDIEQLAISLKPSPAAAQVAPCQLEKLDLSNNKLTNKAIISLGYQLPNLKFIDISYCKNVNLEELDVYLKNNPDLKLQLNIKKDLWDDLLGGKSAHIIRKPS